MHQIGFDAALVGLFHGVALTGQPCIEIAQIPGIGLQGVLCRAEFRRLCLEKGGYPMPTLPHAPLSRIRSSSAARRAVSSSPRARRVDKAEVMSSKPRSPARSS